MKLLRNAFSNWIKTIILSRKAHNKKIPSFKFQDVPDRIRKLLIACFKDKQQLPKSMEDFWAGEDVYNDYDVSNELNINAVILNEDDEVKELKYNSLRFGNDNLKANIEIDRLQN